MAILNIPHARIAGISACVPPQSESNRDYHLLSEKEQEQLIKTTGIAHRRMAQPGTTTSDLAFVAAEKLLDELQWKKDEIQALVLVTQSFDYLVPATSTILQDRLGLPKSCMALDINLGCSGYVYGLSVITSLMAAGTIQKALFLVGDVSSVTTSYKDKSTYPLFGDAATATALEYQPNAQPIVFNLQTDGSGYDAIIIPDGGVRNSASPDSFTNTKYAEGIERNRLQVALNGIEVFNFSLREVVPNIKKLLKEIDKKVDQADALVFHQANRLINETLRKMLKAQSDQVPYSLQDFGNTSSASIPLTLVTQMRKRLQTEKLNLLFSAFGIGLSWGSAWLTTDRIVVPALIEYDREKYHPNHLI